MYRHTIKSLLYNTAPFHRKMPKIPLRVYNSGMRQLAVALGAILLFVISPGQQSLIASIIHDGDGAGSKDAYEQHFSKGLDGLVQSIRDIGNQFSLMSFAMNPGDEDIGALTYARRKLGARTAAVIATTHSLYDCSAKESDGLRRQAVSTSKVEDASCYLLNLPSQGLGTSADSIIQAQGNDSPLARIVQIIREFKPDVIISPDSSADPAAIVLSQILTEAIEKAADDAALPELKLPAWKVSRVLTPTTDEKTAHLKVNLNEYDVSLGASYFQLAARAAGMYNSREQNIPTTRAYKLLEPTPKEGVALKTFFDGIELPGPISAAVKTPKLGGVSLEEGLGQHDLMAETLVGELALRGVLGNDKSLQDQFPTQYFRVTRFISSIRRAIAILLGLDFQLELSRPIVSPGDAFSLNARVFNGSSKTFPLEFQLPAKVNISGEPETNKSMLTTVGAYSEATEKFDYTLPQDLPNSEKVGSSASQIGRYPAESDPEAMKLAQTHNELTAVAQVGLGPIALPLVARVQFQVAPRFEMSISPSTALITDWSTSRQVNFKIRVTDHAAVPFSGEIWVVQKALEDQQYQPVRMTFTKLDETVVVPLKLELPLLKPPLATDVMVELRPESKDSSQALASAKISVSTAPVSVGAPEPTGFIAGSGEYLESALNELGIDGKAISDSELRLNAQEAGLSRYHTIVIDSGAYEAHKDLPLFNDRLLQFVRDGGRLILFPQGKPLDDRKLVFPYPVKMAESNAAPVDTFSLPSPDNALLAAPNKITLADLSGWKSNCLLPSIQEWAPEYTCLVSAGEKAALVLVCSFGKGAFMYAGLDWNSGLGSMNPGAYRVLANLLMQPVPAAQSSN